MTERTEGYGNWHASGIEDVLSRLGVDRAQGLDDVEVARRRATHGANAIVEAARKSLAGMVLRQFADFMILVLIAAAVISTLLGEHVDALAILVIVVLNAVVGAVQEYRAERAVAALRRLAAPQAHVRRQGERVGVAAVELVPGDIVMLGAGDIVPADLRLLEAKDLRTDEAALTGESQAAVKSVDTLGREELPVGDRTNMAFKGTLVTAGRGIGVAVATGMGTELGKIATLLDTAVSAQTPLQQRLAQFGRRLSIAVLGICALIFVAGLLRGEMVLLMFLTAVSLAVAAIPEALPAVVTASLALGARQMSRRSALIRRLPAVETLGSVTFICADKTGTLTQNSMHVERIYADARSAERLPAGRDAGPVWEQLGTAMALSNDAEVDDSGTVKGDPTEAALYEAARAGGYEKRNLDRERPRIGEIPFDADRKRMSTLHTGPGGVVVFTKGAPEQVLEVCIEAAAGAGSGPLDATALLRRAAELAAEGYRVIAFAYRPLEKAVAEPTAASVERDLIFLGLVAMLDPPRPEAPAAVRECRSAGITPIMITGDHPHTALSIARRFGIAGEGDEALTGKELAELDEAGLAARVAHVRVFARVGPEQKIKIVRALQQRGEFVAMTGDGVNDAPALKAANIGVAMGRKGTDVAREASDMVLLDDNFATIVAAVREGRRIFDNIRKFIKYTMTSNAGEIWVLFLAPFLGLPIPLLPVHILWINLVTDGLPGLALAAERGERDLMERAPRPPNESIFAHGMWQHMLWVGLLIGGLSILAQAWAYHQAAAHWQTMVFTVLTFCQLAHVMAIRSEREPLWRAGVMSNPALLGAVGFTVLLQLAVIYVPELQKIFKTDSLSAFELSICFALPLVVLVAVEAEKWLVRRGRLYAQSEAG